MDEKPEECEGCGFETPDLKPFDRSGKYRDTGKKWLCDLCSRTPAGVREMKELANRINAHLRRFEADPEINKRDKTHGLRPYFLARAYYSRGAKIGVIYVDYQGSSNLSRVEAEQYLAWLEAGNVGTHWRALLPKVEK